MRLLVESDFEHRSTRGRWRRALSGALSVIKTSHRRFNRKSRTGTLPGARGGASRRPRTAYPRRGWAGRRLRVVMRVAGGRGGAAPTRQTGARRPRPHSGEVRPACIAESSINSVSIGIVLLRPGSRCRKWAVSTVSQEYVVEEERAEKGDEKGAEKARSTQRMRTDRRRRFLQPLQHASLRLA